MEYRVLGRDLRVSAVGLGCMGLSHAYGPALEENEAESLIRGAYEAGFTFFDTAACYLGTREDGSPAVNEITVGKALRGIRDKAVIATKFGVEHKGRLLIVNSSEKAIRDSVEESLRRLGTECIDLLYQHRIDPKHEPEEVAGVMSDLIREGKITHWGISEADEEYLRRAHAVCPVTAVQNRYSMMARWHESLFPVLEELNIGFVAFSPLANGLLSGVYKKGTSFADGDFRNEMAQYRDDAYDANRELFSLIEHYASEKNATPGQISLAWMLSKKPYIVPIPGSKRIERVKENGASADIHLSEEEVRRIDKALDSLQMSEVFGGHKTV